MKTFTNFCAQGDVMIRRLPDDHVCEGKRIEPVGAYVIVTHSETGHHHVMAANCVELLERPVEGGSGMELLYAIVNAPTELVHLREHDTHEPIRFEPGKYEVRRQREYTPEGYRRAQD